MLEKRRIRKILRNYIAQEEYSSKESLEATQRNEYRYISPNPYRHELKSAILNYKEETLKNAFVEAPSELKAESYSDVQAKILRIFFEASFTRNVACLFLEPIFQWLLSAHSTLKFRLSTLCVHTLTLPIEKYGDNTFLLHEIINSLGDKGIFRLVDSRHLLMELISRGDKEGVQIVTQHSDKEALSTTLNMNGIYTQYGGWAILTLCEEGIELLPNSLSNEAVDAIFGDPDTMPHSLNPSLLSALPLIVNRTTLGRNICPISFADELPYWQNVVINKVTRSPPLQGLISMELEPSKY